MRIDEIKTIGYRLIDEFMNKAHIEVADDIFAADFINHNPGFGTKPDREGLKQFIKIIHDAFSELHFTIEDSVAEANKLVIRAKGHGIHTGDLMGFSPTNKKVNFHTITILRFEQGKAVERWNLTNDMEVARELGFI